MMHGNLVLKSTNMQAYYERVLKCMAMLMKASSDEYFKTNNMFFLYTSNLLCLIQKKQS